MRRRQIGELEVSVLGIGGNNFGTNFFGRGCDAGEVDRILRTGLDAGVNLVDTAEEYSITSFLGEGHSEELIGAALGARRDEAVLSTKFLNSDAGNPGERGAARIIAAVEASLGRLRTDRIDLYQQHFPDPDTPVDEVLEALSRLVADGKVREIGWCNAAPEQVHDAAAAVQRSGSRPFRSCQLQYSLLERPADELLAALTRTGTVVLAYFPLASGLLSGKYHRGQPPPADSRLASDALVATILRDGVMSKQPLLSDARLTTVDELAAFAADSGHSLLELALSWVAAQPSVASVLTGVTSPGQVTANAAALDWLLTPDECAAVDAIVAREADGAES
ncbi:aldo/keto reductase [Trujillonella endophytica]|uniref:Predicted oxidoreductase n=1 Tax=Trujillonella endophytica TaxID=673521 RepID=A0A1H8QPJ9_9ACTN|nr:aldo/keto reductase [Trujillella endophytica]SEO56112.1 Predicted oxidoreductase [Trujillella endophytica]